MITNISAICRLFFLHCFTNILDIGIFVALFLSFLLEFLLVACFYFSLRFETHVMICTHLLFSSFLCAFLVFACLLSCFLDCAHFWGLFAWFLVSFLLVCFLPFFLFFVPFCSHVFLFLYFQPTLQNACLFPAFLAAQFFATLFVWLPLHSKLDMHIFAGFVVLFVANILATCICFIAFSHWLAFFYVSKLIPLLLTFLLAHFLNFLLIVYFLSYSLAYGHSCSLFTCFLAFSLSHFYYISLFTFLRW